jgi:hypothetical protein
LEGYLKGKINYVLANNKKPSAETLQKYAKEKAKFVETDIAVVSKTKVEAIVQDLLSNNVVQKAAGDKLKRSFLRHDSDKLAKTIWELIA